MVTKSDSEMAAATAGCGGGAAAVQQSATASLLKCPRCESTNTKFCYYNNYSLSQPRHFCKACKRYWTRGGTLRNVPVGGGCRKNRRPKKSQPPDADTLPPPLTAKARAPTSSQAIPPFYGAGFAGNQSSLLYGMPAMQPPVNSGGILFPGLDLDAQLSGSYEELFQLSDLRGSYSQLNPQMPTSSSSSPPPQPPAAAEQGYLPMLSFDHDLPEMFLGSESLGLLNNNITSSRLTQYQNPLEAMNSFTTTSSSSAAATAAGDCPYLYWNQLPSTGWSETCRSSG